MGKDKKKEFNIEKFPTSPSAKQMMRMVTQNFWYDRSYVGKWIFQVLGLTMDEVTAIIRSLYNEAFPETCTWSIAYWEQKYGLPIRDYLPLEERRKLVIAHRDTSVPIPPYQMEQMLQPFYEDAEIHIADCNDPGPYNWKTWHPNVFKVFFTQDGTIDLRRARKILNWIKQSHTTYIIQDRSFYLMDETKENQPHLWIKHHLRALFWDYIPYDGTLFYDGGGLYDGEKIYDGTLLFDGDRTYGDPGRYNYKYFFNQRRRYGLGLQVKYRTPIHFFNLVVYDGAIRFDGSHRFDAGGASIYQLGAGLRYLYEIENTERFNSLFRFYAAIYFKPSVLYDGEKYFDGSVMFNRVQISEVKAKMQNRHPVQVNETFGNTAMITKTKNVYRYDGLQTFNGAVNYNSVYRREAIE